MKKYYNQFFALMLAMLATFGFFGYCFLLPSSNEEKQKEQTLIAGTLLLLQPTNSYCAIYAKYDNDKIGQQEQNGDGQYTYDVMIVPLTEADCNLDFFSWDKKRARAIEKIDAEFSSSCPNTKNFILNQSTPLSYSGFDDKASFIQGNALEELKNVIIAKNLNISDLQFATPEQYKEFLSLAELYQFSSWGTYNNEPSCENAVQTKIAEKFSNACSLQHPGGSPTSSCSTTKNLVVTGYCSYGDLDVYNNDGNPDYVSCSTLNDQF